MTGGIVLSLCRLHFRRDWDKEIGFARFFRTVWRTLPNRQDAEEQQARGTRLYGEFVVLRQKDAVFVLFQKLSYAHHKLILSNFRLLPYETFYPHFLVQFSLSAQKLVLLNQVQDSISFRGISVVDEKHFLAGWLQRRDRQNYERRTNICLVLLLPNYRQQNEFRDIGSYRKSGLVMAITQAAEIIVTWWRRNVSNRIYRHARKAFLDAPDCNAQHCGSHRRCSG